MMMQFLNAKHLHGASLLLLFAFASTANGWIDGGDDISKGFCMDRRLTYPEVIDMDELAKNDQVLTLDMEWAEINPGFGDSHGYKNDPNELVCGTTSFKTRAIGGSIPGPTLTISPGSSMKIRFRNKLTYQPDSFSSHVVIDTEMPDGRKLYSVTKELNLTRLNKFNDPDIANFHFHGLHLSSVLPSDDATMEILPGEEFEYQFTIPEDHEPGMHWIHPHHHGSSTLHFVGGAAMVIIVKDPPPEEDEEDEETIPLKEDEMVPGDSNATSANTTTPQPVYTGKSLPKEVRDATERIMVFQEWDIEQAKFVARMAGDQNLIDSFEKIKGGESIGQRFITVNGKFQPILDVPVGEWERWRILYAGWQDLPMQWGITGENEADCEFYLLAKDGIYIKDYPRGPMIVTGGDLLPIPPAGRADFMVRCNAAGGSTRFETLSRRNALIVNAVEEKVDEDVSAEILSEKKQRSLKPLTPWRKAESDLPDYLKDVSEMEASPGCTCVTHMEGYEDSSRTNGHIHRPGNHFMHTSYLGAVVERHLKGTNEHTYHQHVHPYQIISLVDTDDADMPNAYFKIGDWQDSYLDKKQNGGHIVIRYQALNFPGKMMVHCHDTLHSDRGVMQKEYIRDGTEGSQTCQCDIFGPIEGAGIVEPTLENQMIGGVDSVSAGVVVFATSRTILVSVTTTAAAAILLLAL